MPRVRLLHASTKQRKPGKAQPFCVGRSGEDGSFKLTTGDKEGAPAGEYVVTVICPEETKMPKGKISTAPPESKDRFEGAYANPTASKLRAASRTRRRRCSRAWPAWRHDGAEAG